MRYRIYLGLLFCIIVTAFGLLINFISMSVVTKGVNEIELADAEAEIRELYSYLSTVTDRYRLHAFDWAVFDEAYNYILDNDSRFITRNFSQLKVNEMFFTGVSVYDKDCNRLAFVDGSKFDYGDEWVSKEIKYYDQVIKKVHALNLESIEGFLNVDGVAMAFAVHKIYDSFKERPSNGYLLIGHALDSDFRKKTQDISGLRFSILPLVLYNNIQGKRIRENVKFSETPDEIRVYSVVNDFFNQPAFCLELQKPRNIAAFGRELSNKNFLLMLFLCFSVLSAGFFILHIAQRRVMRAKINYRMKHDRLTDLPNHYLFAEKYANFKKSVQKEGKYFAFLYTDIDNFKSVNDSYGYQQGDMILCEIANRLKTLLPENHIFRLGADNFYIVIIGNDNDEVIAFAERILSILSESYNLDEKNIHIGFSIGIAFLSSVDEDVLRLIHRAELAMFESKKRGGNCISIYDANMEYAASSKKILETALYEAVEKDMLSVHFQPKIDVLKNEVAGCEALVRWQTSNGKWISPMEFIPLAEEIGLVTKIDMFVLRTACRQVLAWQHEGITPVPIAVNMSVRSILSEGFADQVIAILQNEGTPTSLIDIEITETCFMSDMDTAFAAISRLHEAGIHIALDDFGTGYSSLQYLSAMPISFLKVDRNFVNGIFSGKVTAQPLVKSILALASNLGMQTICEGVETKNQLAFLAGNGASIIQGYLFSKPLNPGECEEYLRNSKDHIEKVLRAA